MTYENPEDQDAELVYGGDAEFASLMDALAPEEGKEETVESNVQTPTDGATTGSTEPTDKGTGDQSAVVPGANGGTEQLPSVQDAGALGAGATGTLDLPDSWTVDAASLKEDWGTMTASLEKQIQEDFQREAYDAVQQEYPKYFDALQKHPRLLVGQKVPSVTGNGEDTLRDSKDAAEWQDAVKNILVSEIKDRAQRASEENSGVMNTLHESIGIFSSNADLVPGTKGFDRELAERFTKLAEAYELRADGKFLGYTVPVQPMINAMRAHIQAERAATPATPPPATSALATPPPPAEEPPQAGITSKAGNSSEGAEDFSTFFGTIGLPNMRI